jgi:DNA adenine methylase
MTGIKPLFIWAGGKNKMLKFYEDIFPSKVSSYYEPFFGGGACFLYIMKRYNPQKVVINDINFSIINIYKAIKDEKECFLSYCKKYDKEYMPLSKEERKKYYYEIRQKHAYDYESWSCVEESATLYFLMRTGFNGIYQLNKNTNNRYGTPCGLLNQKESVFDWENIERWNAILEKVEICSGDWKESIEDDVKDSFLFFDPPYRGSFTSYGCDFDDSKQKELLSFCEEKSKDNDIFLCNREIEDGFF